jgi:ATP-binding cassette subfamily B multidrug efflux pump
VTESTRDMVLIRRMWPFVRPWRLWLGAAILLTPLGVGAGLLQPILLKQGIDDYIAVGDLEGLSKIAMLFVIVVALAFTARAAGSYALQVAGLRGLTALRRHVFAHVTAQDQRFFDRRTTGSLMTRTTNDVEAVYESLAFGVVNLVTDTVMILGILAIMLALDWRLTLISLSFSPLIVLLVDVFRRRLRSLSVVIRRSLSELNGFFAESIHGITTVQLAGAEDGAKRQFGEMSHRYLDAYRRSNWWDAGLYAIMDGLSALAIGLMLWDGAARFGTEGVTAGLLIAFVDYLVMIFGPIRELSGRFATIQRAIAALERIFALLDAHDQVEAGDTTLEAVRGTLSFNDVHFAYDAERADVLKGVSFDVAAGEVVALVGATGSGKSTLGRLLTRTYGGYAGSITIDGHELSRLDALSVRQHVTVVHQEVTLIEASIEENIALWMPEIGRAEVERAAKLACATSFIEALPGGFNHTLNERGSNLSAGEGQLLCIARALARPAPIVVLDEATASIDSVTEAKVDEALSHLLENRTVMLIAHRLSTITKADRIVVLHEGRVVEQGTHTDLLALDGRYRLLVEAGVLGSSEVTEHG